MAAYFFDSSALIKAYIAERGSRWVRGVTAGYTPPHRNRICISDLARVEVLSALNRLERLRDYSPGFTDTVLMTFARDLRLSSGARRYRVYDITPLSPAVLALADTLLERYQTAAPDVLRRLDALQLASAELARAALPGAERATFTFVTVDRPLRGIADAEGFPTINPEYL